MSMQFDSIEIGGNFSEIIGGSAYNFRVFSGTKSYPHSILVGLF